MSPALSIQEIKHIAKTGVAVAPRLPRSIDLKNSRPELPNPKSVQPELAGQRKQKKGGFTGQQCLPPPVWPNPSLKWSANGRPPGPGCSALPLSAPWACRPAVVAHLAQTLGHAFQARDLRCAQLSSVAATETSCVWLALQTSG